MDEKLGPVEAEHHAFTAALRPKLPGAARGTSASAHRAERAEEHERIDPRNKAIEARQRFKFRRNLRIRLRISIPATALRMHSRVASNEPVRSCGEEAVVASDACAAAASSASTLRSGAAGRSGAVRRCGSRVGSSGTGADSDSRRADRASTIQIDDSSWRRSRRDLCRDCTARRRDPADSCGATNCFSASRTSSRRSPPLAGTFTAESLPAEITSRSRCRTNSRVSACDELNASVAAAPAPFAAISSAETWRSGDLLRNSCSGGSSLVIPNSDDVGLAHQRRLAPEAHQLRRTAADDVRDDHAVDAARRRGSGRVQIGVAIEPQQIDVLVVAARAGKQADRLRAISAEHQNESAALHRDFGVNFQIVESRRRSRADSGRGDVHRRRQKGAARNRHSR